MSAHLALRVTPKCELLIRQVVNWHSRQVYVSVPNFIDVFQHAHREPTPGDSASEGDLDTLWASELAKLSKAVGTTLWLDGIYIRGQVLSGAPSAQQALDRAMATLALARDLTWAPRVEKGAVMLTSGQGFEALALANGLGWAEEFMRSDPETSTPDVHQPGPRCDDAVDRGGIVRTPPPMNALLPETLSGPAPAFGTRRQPYSRQERVLTSENPSQRHHVALHPPRTAPAPYPRPPGAGLGRDSTNRVAGPPASEPDPDARVHGRNRWGQGAWELGTSAGGTGRRWIQKR